MKEDFKKALKKKKGELFGGIFLFGYFVFVFFTLLSMGYSVETISQDSLVILWSITISLVIGFLISIINLISLITLGNLEEKYNLCKRCGRLIKKDKIFCEGCLNKLKRLEAEENDKKLICKYKKVIKEGKKK